MPYVPFHDRERALHAQNYSSTPQYGLPDIDPDLSFQQIDHQGRGMSSQSESGYEVAPTANSSYVPRQRADHYENGSNEEEQGGPSTSRKRPRQDIDNGEYQQQENYQQDANPHLDTYGHIPLTGSIFNVPPRNPFTSVVGDFILQHSQGLDNVEVEIKLGTLTAAVDPTNPNAQFRRIRMPTQSETIMPQDYPLGPFLSTMHPVQYKSLNALLNSAVEQSSQLPGPSTVNGRVKFFRSKLIDTFHPARGSRGKIRVSRDQTTGQVVPNGIVVKRRIADLNVYCPGMPFDWRVSVSVEDPCEMPNTQPTGTREKDRASYKHQVCQVDLTHAVTKSGEGGKPSFELEIEILDVPTLLAEGSDGSDRFDEILQNVLDTARMLVKNSPLAPT